MNANGFISILCSALLCSFLGLAGCQQENLAQQRVQRREQSIGRTAEALVKQEQVRPSKLAKVGPYADHEIRRDTEYLSRDLGTAQRILERDLRRFQERKPRYLDETGKQLWGKPETIERNAVLLFL